MDSNRKCSHFIGYYNQMMSYFDHLNPECCSFYGSFVWKYNSDGFVNCCTQWNKCFRRIYYLPYNTHIWLLGPLIGQYHIRHQFILRDIKFLHRLLQSPNYIIKQCIMNASSNANTLIGYILSVYSPFSDRVGLPLHNIPSPLLSVIDIFFVDLIGISDVLYIDLCMVLIYVMPI